ncbi:HD domain-containing protein [Ferrovum sp. PN-J185]|uniref:HD domain-containing protein n=1 Tax=Ferrovum sp. PN-J185 TaxID=1356306 RepID=UPI00079BDDDC|nr:HD domain-containing protein [Ferrovum sp. PN-J185]KXW56469.1 bifunctional (p)ppGpp synthase/hydrolase RelA [Ferrovum sp. PN-J185]MCC6068182.1 HD domain-containing protein [Ferrovum sp. PN-J185]
MDIPFLLSVIQFAADKHRHQRRKDFHASPYINHPLALAYVLSNEAGIVDINVLSAALLHDTIEDTDTTLEELIERFGSKIASIVLEVTDDKSLPKQQRKQLQIDHAPHSSDEAKLVKLADKICNLRDLFDYPPHGWSVERIHDYFDWSEKVIAGLRGVNPKLEYLVDQLLQRRTEIS